MKTAIDSYLAVKHAFNKWLDPITKLSESCMIGELNMVVYDYHEIMLSCCITKKHAMLFEPHTSSETDLLIYVCQLCQKEDIITYGIENSDKKLEKFVKQILEDLKTLIIDLLCKYELLSVEDYLIYGDLVCRANRQILSNEPIEYKIYKEENTVDNVIANNNKKYIRYLFLLFAEIVCKCLNWID